MLNIRMRFAIFTLFFAHGVSYAQAGSSEEIAALVAHPICEVVFIDDYTEEQRRLRLEALELRRRDIALSTRAKLDAKPSPARRVRLEKLLSEVEGELAAKIQLAINRKMCARSNPESHSYVKEVQLRIEDCGTTNFPRSKGKKVYGAADAAFILDSHGQLVSTEVLHSSKSAVIDAHVIRLIEASAPFGIPPSPLLAGGFDRIRFSANFRFWHDRESSPIRAPGKRCAL
jgi:TonB C terminal